MALFGLIDQLLQSAQLAMVTVMPAAKPLMKRQARRLKRIWHADHVSNVAK